MELKYLPIFLDIKQRPCLIIGGGTVARRKISVLLKAGADVTVVAANYKTPQKNVHWIKRNYKKGDEKGFFLVVAATSDKNTSKLVFRECKKRKILINTADNPDLCGFIFPSIVQRGDLVIAVSTSGCCPAFAKKIKKEIELKYGREYADFIKLLGKIRSEVIQKISVQTRRK
ncbi:MAG: bifunctional precorrin-2 dehydrogenase/sirohydrochlorin ferrochelatase [bacterium]